MASSASLNVEATTQQPRRPWRLKPTVRRQARLDLDVPQASQGKDNNRKIRTTFVIYVYAQILVPKNTI